MSIIIIFYLIYFQNALINQSFIYFNDNRFGKKIEAFYYDVL